MLAEQTRKQASFVDWQPESVHTSRCSAGGIIIVVLYFGASKSGTTCASGTLSASCDSWPLPFFLTGVQFVQVSMSTQQDSEGHQKKLPMNLFSEHRGSPGVAKRSGSGTTSLPLHEVFTLCDLLYKLVQARGVLYFICSKDFIYLF